MTAPHVDGAIIARLRAERHWTRAELSHRAGIHPRHLLRIEAGRAVPRDVTVYKIADALNVSVAELAPAGEDADSEDTEVVEVA